MKISYLFKIAFLILSFSTPTLHACLSKMAPQEELVEIIWNKPLCQKISRIVESRILYYQDERDKLSEHLEAINQGNFNLLRDIGGIKWGESYFRSLAQDRISRTIPHNLEAFMTYFSCLDEMDNGDEKHIATVFEFLLISRFEYLKERQENIRKYLEDTSDGSGQRKIFLFTCPEAIRKYSPSNQYLAHECIDNFEATNEILRIIFQNLSSEYLTAKTRKILELAPCFSTYLKDPAAISLIPDDLKNREETIKYRDTYYQYIALITIGGEKTIQEVHIDDYQKFLEEQQGHGQSSIVFQNKDGRPFNKKDMERIEKVANKLSEDKKKEKKYHKKKKLSRAEIVERIQKEQENQAVANRQKEEKKAIEQQAALERQKSRESQKASTSRSAEDISSDFIPQQVIQTEDSEGAKRKEKIKTRGIPDPNRLGEEENPGEKQQEPVDSSRQEKILYIHHQNLWKTFDRFWQAHAMSFESFKTLFEQLGGLVEFSKSGSSHVKLLYTNRSTGQVHTSGTWRPHGFCDGFGKHTLSYLRAFFTDCELTREFVKYSPQRSPSKESDRA